MGKHTGQKLKANIDPLYLRPGEREGFHKIRKGEREKLQGITNGKFLLLVYRTALLEHFQRHQKVAVPVPAFQQDNNSRFKFFSVPTEAGGIGLSSNENCFDIYSTHTVPCGILETKGPSVRGPAGLENLRSCYINMCFSYVYIP